MSQLPLRPNVCMFLFNKNRQLFIGERAGAAGHWQLPQGGVEPELSLEENVIQELHEELGCKKQFFRIIQKCASTHEYEFASPPDYAKDRWRGQSQTFWLVEFTGKDSDIHLENSDEEFSSWQWVTPGKLLDIVAPIRRDGYRAALEEFEAWNASNPA